MQTFYKTVQQKGAAQGHAMDFRCYDSTYRVMNVIIMTR